MNRRLRKNKIPLMIYILGFMQIVFIFILATHRVVIHIIEKIYAFDLEDLALTSVLVVMIILFYFLFKVALKIKSDENRSQLQQETIKNMQEMNQKIRSQRHDFLNHMQIVYSLIELKEYAEAESYLKELYGEIERVNKFLKTKDAALNSLLQAKSNDAQRRGINFETNIRTHLENCAIQSIDICRVMGNLIDNALYAAENYDNVLKNVCVTVAEGIDDYEFIVENTGANITLEQLPKLFTSGYTTKGKNGEGMGLFIVKKTADFYNGSVLVSSQSNLTSFTVVLKKPPSAALGENPKENDI